MMKMLQNKNRKLGRAPSITKRHAGQIPCEYFLLSPDVVLYSLPVRYESPSNPMACCFVGLVLGIISRTSSQRFPKYWPNDMEEKSARLLPATLLLAKYPENSVKLTNFPPFLESPFDFVAVDVIDILGRSISAGKIPKSSCHSLSS